MNRELKIKLRQMHKAVW